MEYKFNNNMEIKIAPSILSADFGKLNEDIASVENFVDLFHLDIMDGHFVPNLTFGAPVVKCINSSKPLHAHLMTEKPWVYIDDFLKSGVARIIVHVEACDDLRSVIEQISQAGLEVGVSIKPKTPVSAIYDVLNLLDEVLVMTVEPGFGGQEFMADMLPKISELREMRADMDIGVDGGINAETAVLAVDAGANILISGSYIFGASDRQVAVDSLRV